MSKGNYTVGYFSDREYHASQRERINTGIKNYPEPTTESNQLALRRIQATIDRRYREDTQDSF